MLKELFATCLLLHGCSSRCLNSVYDYTNDSNDNNIVERVSVPQYASNGYNNTTVFGVYNFRDTFDYSSLEDGYIGNTYYFEDEVGDRRCIISITDGGSMYFLHSIQLSYSALLESCIVLVSYYDDENVLDTEQFTVFHDLANLIDYQYMFFNVLQPVYFAEEDYALFDILFTHDDNFFITSYNGYFNMFNNSSLSGYHYYNVFGSIAFNNSLSYCYNFVLGSYTYQVDTLSLDSSTGTLVINRFGQSDLQKNVLFNNVKMSRNAYLDLQNIGIFAYVHDTSYDDSTFNDLLFSIMDSPIYMLSRLLNFELFGTNLFIAFTGLLTLALIVVVIRKIW